MRFNALLALLALAAGTSALAQQTPPATPAAPAAAPAEVPRHKCAKPGPIPGENTSTDRQMLQYSKDYKEYTDCLKTFALAQQKLAEPHMKAANDAVNEYNTAVKTFNDEMERRKEGK